MQQHVLNVILETFADEKKEQIDGVTVLFDNGSWFNVRPSNTEPLLRLNAEARTQAELDALVTKVKTFLV